MYLLTYKRNITWMPNWLASAVDRLAYLTGDRLPNPQGWELADLKTGRLIARNSELCADESACFDAMDWADTLISLMGMSPVIEWHDRQQSDDLGDIEFIALTDPAWRVMLDTEPVDQVARTF